MYKFICINLYNLLCFNYRFHVSIRNWPLTTQEDNHHYRLKTSPNWFSKLGLISFKALTLRFVFICGDRNPCFPVCPRSETVALCHALTGSLCLLLPVPMGIKVDPELGAKWEMSYVSCQNNVCCHQGRNARVRMTAAIKEHSSLKSRYKRSAVLRECYSLRSEV